MCERHVTIERGENGFLPPSLPKTCSFHTRVLGRRHKPFVCPVFHHRIAPNGPQTLVWSCKIAWASLTIWRHACPKRSGEAL